MEFIIGMYDDDWSGDTDIMRIRGSGKSAGSSERVFNKDEGLVTLLISTVYV